jgi:hypothetical protein
MARAFCDLDAKRRQQLVDCIEPLMCRLMLAGGKVRSIVVMVVIEEAARLC